jgi:hypothetical protein
MKVKFEKIPNHNYLTFQYWVIMHGPKCITIYNEGKLFTKVIHVYHPFHVDVGMAKIQQTFKCLELIIGK